MEKWMIVYMLPLEVWMDIFCFPWISRSEEFGQLVAQIGNFKFAEHAQFFLHEWGKRKLGDLTFKKKGCLYKLVDGRSYRLEHPQTPMPENIKSFDCIHIRHFDSNTLGFLAKIKPLLTDLKIVLRSIPASRQENLRTILANLASMLADGIRSVFCCDASTSFPLVKEQLFCENDEKLAKLKMLEINDVSYISEMQQQELIKFIMKWLIGQPDTNGQPRLLQFHSRPEFYEQMFKTIREVV